MSTISWRWHFMAAAALVGAALACWWAGSSRGQQPKPGAANPGELKATYTSTEQCAFCHTQPPPGVKKTFLCRLTEFQEWKKGDKHQEANKVLKGERGRQMAERLGYDVTARPQCTSCHGGMPADEQIAKASKENGYTPDDGVTCVICHGPYQQWVDEHSRLGTLEKWRHYSRQKKQDEYGMTDLWDPVTRAETCASCHIGNAAAGRVVTHEMYAAGHPPLPSVEVATFCDQMPRHWQLLREKDAKVQEALSFDSKDREQTRLVLVGAAVGLKAAMQLLAAEANRSVAAREAGDRGLDFASFDCASCHHDLKSPSWRQTAGSEGKAGRPAERQWSAALIRLVILHASPEEAEAERQLSQFEKDLKAVHAGFLAQPLGDARQVGPAAARLAKWAEDLAGRAAKAPCDPERARELLHQLPALYRAKTVDYDSARDIAWALRVMYHELEPNPDREVTAALDALDQSLRLQLPSGTQRSISGELGKNLEAMNNYDPEEFKKALARVASRLSQR
jgi:hypothetical protein